MNELLDNFKFDYLYSIDLCCFLAFVIFLIILAIIELVELDRKIPELITNIVLAILSILGIITMLLFLLTQSDNKTQEFNLIKETYNIEQNNDILKFTKKPGNKNFLHKNEVKYTLKKEKITNNYKYNNQNISEIEEENYNLEDTYNHKTFKLNKNELKQLIGYKNTESEKVNIDDLKS